MAHASGSSRGENENIILTLSMNDVIQFARLALLHLLADTSLYLKGWMDVVKQQETCYIIYINTFVIRQL